jgi:hypothetical protein
MTHLLKPAPVSWRQLTWLPAERKFVAEISDTNGFGRVWDDSCDLGLTIVGKTGREVVFVIWADHRDAEGELTHWELRPAVGQRPHPGLIDQLVGVTLTLFND